MWDLSESQCFGFRGLGLNLDNLESVREAQRIGLHCGLTHASGFGAMLNPKLWANSHMGLLFPERQTKKKQRLVATSKRLLKEFPPPKRSLWESLKYAGTSVRLWDGTGTDMCLLADEPLELVGRVVVLLSLAVATQRPVQTIREFRK